MREVLVAIFCLPGLVTGFRREGSRLVQVLSPFEPCHFFLLLLKPASVPCLALRLTVHFLLPLTEPSALQFRLLHVLTVPLVLRFLFLHVGSPCT